MWSIIVLFSLEGFECGELRIYLVMNRVNRTSTQSPQMDKFNRILHGMEFRRYKTSSIMWVCLITLLLYRYLRVV